MTALLLLLTVTAGQDSALPPVRKTIVSAAPASPHPRCRLLPSLLEQEPGDAFPLFAEIEFALGEVPARDEDAVRKETSREDLRGVLRRYEKVLALVEKAALRTRCDWGPLTAQLRRGEVRCSPLLDKVTRAFELLPLQARWHLLEDRPAEAIRATGRCLRIALWLSEGPDLSGKRIGWSLLFRCLDGIDEAMEHPRCPNLYWALTELPRPLWSLRSEGEVQRLRLWGGFPGLHRLVENPAAELPGGAEMAVWGKTVRELVQDGLLPQPVLDMQLMALRLYLQDPASRDVLLRRGYPAERIDAWPRLVRALLPALLDADARMGEAQLAWALPAADARPRCVSLDLQVEKERSRQFTDLAPALPLNLALLSCEGMLVQVTALERRLEVLRTIEALHLEAHTTGRFPARLADITAVPVPTDPVTGKPFRYGREGNEAVLDVGSISFPGGGWYHRVLRPRERETP
jgi:hypothetical protein